MITRFVLLLALALTTKAAPAETLEIPATANPWLAGMAGGSTARRGDSAPQESPVCVTNTPIEGHAVYTFSASGTVNHGATLPFFPPDGENLTSHYLGAENGIADIGAPFTSLIGVFLGPDQPDETPAPQPLDFSTLAERDYLELAPALKQPFFIGAGLTSSGAAKQIVAPAGATRLLLGVMDEYYWADNQGAFTVQVTKLDSVLPARLLLQPSSNPADANEVANPISATSVTTDTSANTPAASGPELHAFSAIELVWPSETNCLYQVQWTPSLEQPQWVNLGPVVFGSGTELSELDSTRTHPQGFYRVQLLSLPSLSQH